jgi:hypothetical protein
MNAATGHKIGSPSRTPLTKYEGGNSLEPVVASLLPMGKPNGFPSGAHGLPTGRQAFAVTPSLAIFTCVP